MFAVHWRGPFDGRHRSQDHRGVGGCKELRTTVADHRSRSGRIDGAQEARRLFLMSGLLRICTAGSLDDGKSTLIGRLLYDSRAVYEDQLHSVRTASKNRSAGPIDFSLFTD